MANPIPPKHKPTDYRDDVDFKSVVKEAAAAVDYEEKYSRENDAKFRAVYQRVETYDQFRDIVLASNLKPLEKTDTLAVKLKDTWNVNATNSENEPVRTREHRTTENQLHFPSSGEIVVNSQSEFYQIYKCLSPVDKYQFLLRISGEYILALFPTEIEVFDDIISVLSREFKSSDRNEIVHFMAQLSCMKRFSISLLFMGKSTKLNLESLLKLITDSEESSPPNEELEKVVNKYT